MSSAVISRNSSDALDRVMAFFGIEPCNRALFGVAAREAGVENFARVIEAIDRAAAADARSGMNLRIRDRIERQKALDDQVKAKGRVR